MKHEQPLSICKFMKQEGVMCITKRPAAPPISRRTISASQCTSMCAYLCKQNEVLEACIQVSFSLQLTDLVEVGAIYVRIHTEESLEYFLHDFLEIVGKR